MILKTGQAQCAHTTDPYNKVIRATRPLPKTSKGVILSSKIIGNREMSVESIATAGLRSVIGTLMRIYRASPLYPQYGPMLAKLLASVMRDKSTGIIREIDGVRFELDLREMIDASLFYSGTWEAEAERTITGALKPGMIAFDIGANIGYHTFRMAKAVGQLERSSLSSRLR
jgi:hypothetical protein